MTLLTMTLLEDTGVLRERDLWLELRAREPAYPPRGWVPAYRFAMRLDGVDEAVGRLSFRVGSTHTIEHYAGHIGYEVTPEFRRARLAERSCRLWPRDRGDIPRETSRECRDENVRGKTSGSHW